MADIMHQMKIAAAPASVYAALSTQEGIRAWWTRDTTLHPRIGGTGEFAFYARRTVTKVTVEDSQPSARVAWKVTESTHPSGWAGTTIAFDLRADGSDTVVAFSHRNFSQADEGYARVTTGWAYYLVSLRQYLETGTGVPNPDDGTLRIAA